MKRVPPGIFPAVSIDRRSKAPLHRQLYDGFRDAILARRLAPGQRIPSTRSLARELRISRLPALDAYDQLLAEGYLRSGVGSGTFVAQDIPGGVSLPPREPLRAAAPGRRRRVSRETDVVLAREPEPWLQGRGAFRLSGPAIDRFPHDAWCRIVGRQARGARRDPALMYYGDPMGHRPLREAVAEYVRAARAVRCEADQVMIVSGSQQALSLAARVLIDPGDPVWVEEPGYGGARAVLALRGASLVPVPVDESGLDVSAGIRRCPSASAAYVTPSHQYPLGMVLTATRRLQLLDWARRNGSWIVEDDYDSEYRYESDPIASLQGLDTDSRVLYVGTFSKVLFPALRLGYLVIPADLVPRFAAVRDASDIFPPTSSQAVLAEFIREGHFVRHLRRMRALYRERRLTLVGALRERLGDLLTVAGDEAGLHLVACLRDGRRDDRAVSARAARQGLWTMPLSSCYVGSPERRGFVLGFGGTSPAEIRAGVRRLRSVLDTESPP
jgi:GntR family transcriptional regulator/MocR family aminotransferase